MSRRAAEDEAPAALDPLLEHLERQVRELAGDPAAQRAAEFALCGVRLFDELERARAGGRKIPEGLVAQAARIASGALGVALEAAGCEYRGEVARALERVQHAPLEAHRAGRSLALRPHP